MNKKILQEAVDAYNKMHAMICAMGNYAKEHGANSIKCEVPVKSKGEVLRYVFNKFSNRDSKPSSKNFIPLL